jgi:hypothetical protein
MLKIDTSGRSREINQISQECVSQHQLPAICGKGAEGLPSSLINVNILALGYSAR